MKKRIISGIILAFILIPLLLVKDLFPLLQVVLILLCVIATIEMINMCEKKRPMKLPVKIIIIVSTMLIYFGIVNENEACKNSLISILASKIDFQLTTLMTLTLSCAAVFACQVFVDEFDAADVGSALMIILYVSLSFSALTVMLFNGVRFLVYLGIVCFGTDIFAYVFGMKFGRHGRHKLCPKISPKKSWEGAIGGTVCGTVLASLFAIFYDLFGHYFVTNGEPHKFFANVFNYEAMHPAVIVTLIIVISFLLSICSQVGDLICSKFKRTYDIKDFSQAIPGHGGILDRFDSVLFASIVFLCIITIFRIALPLIM
jgi:phosphatidate cytidylyltransferase